MPADIFTIDPERASRYREIVAGRRVAIVGPSRASVGSGHGAHIDGYDLVVRLNHQWPVPRALEPDLGSRMDVLYHCCNGDFPVGRLFQPGFERTRFVCYEEGPDRASLASECDRAGIEAMEITALYVRWFQALGSYPNTGFVAMAHLVEQPIVELHVAGFSFHRDPYYDGYLASGNRPDRWADGQYPRRTWWHDADKQLGAFKAMAGRDGRITMDARLREIVEAASPPRDDGISRPAGG